MSYNAKSLRKIGMTFVGAGSVRHKWLYATTDARATVEAANYFTDNRLAKGDIIECMMAISSTPPVFESYGVTVLSASYQATITRHTATGLTDSTGGTVGSTLALAAVKQKLIIPVPSLVDLVNAAVWKAVVPFAHVLESATFRTGKPATTAAKAATLTATVGGVAVTGGVIALTSANQATTGTNTDATAISGAGATGAAGGTIEWTVSSVTAFVEGNGYIEMTVINKDLANALASLNAA